MSSTNFTTTANIGDSDFYLTYRTLLICMLIGYVVHFVIEQMIPFRGLNVMVIFFSIKRGLMHLMNSMQNSTTIKIMKWIFDIYPPNAIGVRRYNNMPPPCLPLALFIVSTQMLLLALLIKYNVSLISIWLRSVDDINVCMQLLVHVKLLILCTILVVNGILKLRQLFIDELRNFFVFECIIHNSFYNRSSYRALARYQTMVNYALRRTSNNGPGIICTICLNPMNHPTLCILHCAHGFCMQCMNTWEQIGDIYFINNNEPFSNCPTCRKPYHCLWEQFAMTFPHCSYFGSLNILLWPVPSALHQLNQHLNEVIWNPILMNT